MADVLTRVELHGYPEDSSQYRSLHGFMEAAGFSRTIPCSNGKVYKLPHATYYSTRYANPEAANNAAVAAAGKVITTKGHGVNSSGINVWMQGLAEA